MNSNGPLLGEKTRGHLVITVSEASGLTKEKQPVWEPNFVEGFVKVEVRGGPRNVKVQSRAKKVFGNTIDWQEELYLEVLEGSTELRLMLCREKRSGARVGTSVIAACGIYVNDILDAVPIDKYFELFKPGAGGEGGFIRIGMNFTQNLKEYLKSKDSKVTPPSFNPQLSFKDYKADDSIDSVAREAGLSQDGAAEVLKLTQGDRKKKKGFPFIKLLLLASAAAAGVAYKIKKS